MGRGKQTASFNSRSRRVFFTGSAMRASGDPRRIRTIVTGGFSGLGAHTVRHLAGLGAHVLVAARP